MGGLHWRKKGGGKDAGGSSARKQVVLTAAQLTELESYIQDMEAKCAQFQQQAELEGNLSDMEAKRAWFQAVVTHEAMAEAAAVVAHKAAAEAAMRGQLEGLAAEQRANQPLPVLFPPNLP
ncbi:unnamed protein product [Closterium sp. NIES-65]|nr:unnamed protein product [Closterium sp. NIES-65]